MPETSRPTGSSGPRTAGASPDITGLLLAEPAPVASVAGSWREFRAVGALPDLAALSYVARAITPPGRTRRFDARFFMADAADALAVALTHAHMSATAGRTGLATALLRRRR